MKDIPSREEHASLALLPLPVPDATRRAVGDRLEAAAHHQQRRRRLVRAGAAVALAAGLTVALLVVRAGRPPSSAATAERDRLRTGTGDFQLLSLDERGVAFVSEETEVELRRGQSPAVVVHRGSVRFVIRPRSGGPFVVRTAAADIQVLGTEFDVGVTGGITNVSVVHGQVEVRNPHGRRRLWSREAARARVGEPPRMAAPVYGVVEGGMPDIQEKPR